MSDTGSSETWADCDMCGSTQDLWHNDVYHCEACGTLMCYLCYYRIYDIFIIEDPTTVLCENCCEEKNIKKKRRF